MLLIDFMRNCSKVLIQMTNRMRFRRLMTHKQAHIDLASRRWATISSSPLSTLFGFLCKHQTVPQHHFHKRLNSPSTPVSSNLQTTSLSLFAFTEKSRWEMWFLGSASSDYQTLCDGSSQFTYQCSCDRVLVCTKLSFAELTQFDALIKVSLS